MASETGAVILGITYDGDEQSAQREADRMANLISDGMLKGLAGFGKQFAKQFATEFARASKSGSSAFNHLSDQSAEFAAAGAKHSQRLRDEYEALNATFLGFRRTLERSGAEPELFRTIENQLALTQSRLRDFDRDVERGLADPVRLEGLEKGMDQSRAIISRQTAAIQTLLNQQRTAERIAANQRLQEQRLQETGRLNAQKQAHGKAIVEAQREGALRLADARTTGQRIIQQERATQRTRVEIFRFALQQIRTLERSIGSIFRTSAAVISGGFARVESTIFRIGSVLKRSNRDMNDGLRPALLSREQAISRSFRRQQDDVSRSLAQQSVILKRFEAQASTGISGALSGRSQLGSLVGGGLAIGGGVGVIASLRNQIKVGGDFVQGLAVLQAQLKLTGDEMAGVRAQAIELGNDIALPGVSALDAAGAIQILGKQFASLGEAALPAAQAAARGTLLLARASGASAEEAARIIGAAVNVFGISADKATDVADQVTNALTNAAGVGFQQFADAFQQSAAVFAQFQVPAVGAEEALTGLNTALAILARSGNVGSDAGTSLKQFFLSTVRSSAPAKKALNAVAERAGIMGSVFFDQAGAARPLAETLDILRRGLKGVSDQARNTSLNAIFGSDAIRTANALLNVSTEEFERLAAAMGETGTAAKIAAAQNTGLRGAMDALNSVIETQQIKTYERYQKVLGNVVLKFADLLNKFFEGIGIFGIVRDGLLGVGAALLTLLAAKGAAEAIGFLTLGLRALLTPLGLLVTAAAVLGAAINILRTRVPEVGAALDTLGRAFSASLGFAIRTVTELLLGLGKIVGNFLAPLIVRFAGFIENNLERALVRTFGFIERTAIPAIKRFADVILTGLVTAINTLREVWSIFVHDDFTGVGPWEQDSPIVTSLFRFREIVADVLGGVQRIATDTFGSIGDLTAINPTKIVSALGGAALGTAIGGPLGTAIGAAVGFALGGANFSKVADQLTNALRPQLEKVADFVRDFFTGGGGAGGAASKSVEGFLVGPFQNAVRSLGFFLGNLLTDPRLVQAIEQLIGLAALTGANFATGFVTGAVSNLPGLMNDLVGQIDSAFQAALSTAFRDPRQFAKILAGVFVATAVLRAFFSAGEQGARGMIRGFATGLRAQAAQAPQFLTGFFGGRAAIDAAGAQTAQRFNAALAKEFAKGNRDLGRLGSIRVQPQNDLGLITAEDVARQRERLAIVKGAIGEVGAAGIIARQRLREGFRGIADDFTDLSAQMGSKGRAIGSIVGVGIVSGVSAALAGQAAGNASGAGGVALGLSGVLASALIPLTTLGPTLGGPIAGLTLLVGGLTAAVTAHGKAAKKAAEETDEYVDAITRSKSASEQLSNIVDTVLANIADEAPEVQALLNSVGFDAGIFADQVTRGVFDTQDALDLLAPAFKGSVGDIVAELRRLDAEGRDPVEALNLALGGTSDRSLRTLKTAVEGLPRGDVVAFADALGALTDEGAELQAGLPQANVFTELSQRATRDLGAINQEFERTVRNVDGLNQRQIDLEFADIVAQQRGLDRFNETLDLTGDAITRLNEQRTSTLQGQIAEVTGELTRARDAAQQAFNNVIALFDGELFAPFQQKLDDLLLGAVDVGKSLTDAITGSEDVAGIDISKLFDFGDVGGAQLRQILNPFSVALRDTVKQAITEGATTPEALREALAPATTTIQNLDVPQVVKDALLDQINGFLESEGLAAGLEQIVITNEAATQLQTELDNLQARLPVRVEFNEFQIAAELRRMQELGLFTGAIPSISEIAAAQAAAADRLSPDFTSPRTADAAERVAGGNVVIENLNINGNTAPVTTASETTRALRRAAASGSFQLIGIS